jgi:hypothetical protein
MALLHSRAGPCARRERGELSDSGPQNAVPPSEVLVSETSASVLETSGAKLLELERETGLEPTTSSFVKSRAN